MHWIQMKLNFYNQRKKLMYTTEFTINSWLYSETIYHFQGKIYSKGAWIKHLFSAVHSLPLVVQKNKSRQIKIYNPTSSSHKYLLSYIYIIWREDRGRESGDDSQAATETDVMEGNYYIEELFKWSKFKIYLIQLR